MKNAVSINYTHLGVALTLVFAVFTFMEPALANGLEGGIKTATTAATKIKDAMILIGGIVAIIYLLYKAVQLWQGRADWGEFGMSVGYVAVAGAAATLAGWAWELMQ